MEPAAWQGSYFGARTGGTNIIEGTIEILLGLFFSASVAGLFAVFPSAIIGAMMFLVGIELTKFAKNIRLNEELLPLGATIIVSLLSNMALGFVAGLFVHHLTRFLTRQRDLREDERQASAGNSTSPDL